MTLYEGLGINIRMMVLVGLSWSTVFRTWPLASCGLGLPSLSRPYRVSELRGCRVGDEMSRAFSGDGLVGACSSRTTQPDGSEP